MQTGPFDLALGLELSRVDGEAGLLHGEVRALEVLCALRVAAHLLAGGRVPEGLRRERGGLCTNEANPCSSRTISVHDNHKSWNFTGKLMKF